MERHKADSIQHIFLESEASVSMDEPTWRDVKMYLERLKSRDGYCEMIFGWYDSILSVLKKENKYVLCITYGLEHTNFYNLECLDIEISKSIEIYEFEKIKHFVWKFYKFEQILSDENWTFDFEFI